MKSFIIFFALLIHFSSFAQISTDGLLAYYPFDGNTLDEGPDGYDGINNGGNFAMNEEGIANSALLLDGIGDFVDISAFSNTFKENFEEMAIFFKVRFDEIGDDQTIVSLSSNGEDLTTNVFEIEYENMQLQVETETGSASINHELEIDQPQFLLDGQWHDILINIRADSLWYLRDGEVIYEGLYVPAETSVNKMFVGAYNGTGPNPCCFFGGVIDELQFYNRILPKSEVYVNTIDLPGKNELAIYPNPSQGELTLRFTEVTEKMQLRIINSSGILVGSYSMDNIKELTARLPEDSGVYFLQLFGDDGLLGTTKVVRL